MATKLRQLPRLSRLRSFEAAARHLSFTEASRELAITQAAVSQQVRILEQELGVALFERLHRGLRLTPQGQRLLRSVSTAFGQIAHAADEVRCGTASPVLKIGATFAIATFWLMPRLSEFRERHPDIEVRLIVTDRGFERVADQVDVGVAFGEGTWEGFRLTLLRDGVAFPVCSAAYLSTRPPITEVEQLTHETLLSLEDDRPGRLDWPTWFGELGVDARGLVQTFKVNSHPLLVQAACEGQGIALGWSLLTDDLIAAGRLVRPVEAELRSSKGYFLVEGPNWRREEIACFRAWLFDRVAADAAPTSQEAGQV
jgi:LysR family transcriptional regulator, glycine cleavage system transcriptional activator